MLSHPSVHILVRLLFISTTNALTSSSKIHASTAAPVSAGISLVSPNATFNLNAPPTYPVDCFHPGQVAFEPAVTEDCELVINEIILRLPNPMAVQTFGFDDSADINLRSSENRHWTHEHCIVTIGSVHESKQDRFRPVDVAITTQRIIQECVFENKNALGGTAQIGKEDIGYYVALTGVSPATRAGIATS